MTGARKIRSDQVGNRTHIRILQSILVTRHWTHQQLADEIGVTRTTLSRWIHGNREPHVVWMKVIRAIQEQDAA